MTLASGVTARESTFAAATPCFHGGAFFDRIGVEFDRLERRRRVVNADVLDAWFPPAPGVLRALRRELPWLLRTSPPTQCEGLVRAIARVRGVPAECVVPGAGSSDLIYRALLRWLDARSSALILDPSYGEYAHVLERVLGCRLKRQIVRREDGFALDLDALARRIARERPDLLVLVNPDNPTGRHLRRAQLEPWLASLPARTRVWIDEAYVDYVGRDESLERFAAASDHVVVCKSLSKGLALSGARAAYLVAPPSIAGDLRRVTPPWAVSLPAQVAAVAALREPEHYDACYVATARLRADLLDALAPLAHDGRWRAEGGAGNWVLVHLDSRGPDAAAVVERCARGDIFLRDAGATSRSLGRHAVRVAVRPAQEQRAIVRALACAITH